MVTAYRLRFRNGLGVVTLFEVSQPETVSFSRAGFRFAHTDYLSEELNSSFRGDCWRLNQALSLSVLFVRLRRKSTLWRNT